MVVMRIKQKDPVVFAERAAKAAERGNHIESARTWEQGYKAARSSRKPTVKAMAPDYAYSSSLEYEESAKSLRKMSDRDRAVHMGRALDMARLSKDKDRISLVRRELDALLEDAQRTSADTTIDARRYRTPGRNPVLSVVRS